MIDIKKRMIKFHERQKTFYLIRFDCISFSLHDYVKRHFQMNMPIKIAMVSSFDFWNDHFTREQLDTAWDKL